MHRLFLGLTVAFFCWVAAITAANAETGNKVGRYSISGGLGAVILLDTCTGLTWRLTKNHMWVPIEFRVVPPEWRGVATDPLSATGIAREGDDIERTHARRRLHSSLSNLRQERGCVE